MRIPLKYINTSLTQMTPLFDEEDNLKGVSILHKGRRFLGSRGYVTLKFFTEDAKEFILKKFSRGNMFKDIKKLKAENAKLKREIEVLRLYGNKDCTAMADDVLESES